MPNARAADVSRIESAEAASDIENEGFPPHKEQKDAYDGVLTTRREQLEYEPDLSLRNEYFRNLTTVADEYDQDGMHFWRLSRHTGLTGPSEDERMTDDSLIVYAEDTETLEVVADYYDTVAGE